LTSTFFGGKGGRGRVPLLETHSEFAPDNRPGPKGNDVFQPLIFRGYVIFREEEYPRFPNIKREEVARRPKRD